MNARGLLTHAAAVASQEWIGWENGSGLRQLLIICLCDLTTRCDLAGRSTHGVILVCADGNSTRPIAMAELLRDRRVLHADIL